MRNFYTNGQSPDSITFNGRNVNKVYYNNVLVWDGEYSMSDIYSLCKERQNGTLDAFPSQIQVGLRVPVSVSGLGTFYAELIDVESNGRGILIFQQKTALMDTDGWPFNLTEGDNYLRTNISNYMKQLYIGCTTGRATYANPDVRYTIEYKRVWDLSYLEITDKSYFYTECYQPSTLHRVEWEYTAEYSDTSYEGTSYAPTNIKYPHLQVAANRVCLDESGKPVKYQLRSPANISVGSNISTKYEPIYCYAVLADGSVGPNDGSVCNSAGTTTYSIVNDPDGYHFPCFAIG